MFRCAFVPVGLLQAVIKPSSVLKIKLALPPFDMVKAAAPEFCTWPVGFPVPVPLAGGIVTTIALATPVAAYRVERPDT